ncbi:barstar family protein [Streptomyces mesophilus]|uniref:barstar family protein n=1 Tax=Streptomyces mesophilus TaxID=1775132 RepID=UPI00332C002B
MTRGSSATGDGFDGPDGGPVGQGEESGAQSGLSDGVGEGSGGRGEGSGAQSGLSDLVGEGSVVRRGEAGGPAGCPPGQWAGRPEPLAALVESARGSAVPLHVLDLSGVTDKSAFLAACARVLAFPSWFGRNWDALADSLSDLAPGTVVVVSGWRAYAAARPEEWETAREILAEAVPLTALLTLE